MKPRLLYTLPVLFLLLCCSRHYRKQQQEFRHYGLQQTADDAAARDLIAAYKTRVDAETERIIAVSAAALTRSGDQSTLGNFVCDAMRFAADSLFRGEAPDLVIANRGGLRADLPAGNIKTAAIFELMPFENDLVLLTVSGEKLKGFIPLFEQKKHAFLGATLVLERNKITTFIMNGLPIDNSKTYCILTNDFVANGGDNFTFLSSPLSRRHSTMKVREAIIRYCIYLDQQGKQIIPYTDGRLEITQ